MKKTDLLTIVSISALSWVILMVSHELLGHGGACVLIGGTPKYYDAMYFVGSYPDASYWQEKLVKAGGSIINILIGLTSLLLLFKLKNKKSWLGYFLWITMIINFLQSGNYIAFGRFIHEGMDWAKILEDASPLWFWQSSELIFGLSLIVAGFYYGRKFQKEFLNLDKSILIQNFRILILPLITITIVSVSAAYYVPSEDRMMMIMGGIGNSLFFLFGMIILAFIPFKKEKLQTGFQPKRNFKIIIPSVLITLVYVFIISKGIDL